MAEDQAINLDTLVDAPHFTPSIGEEYFFKECERWVGYCNNERQYRYQAYRHSGDGIFNCYTFIEAFNVYLFAERACFYIPLRSVV